MSSGLSCTHTFRQKLSCCASHQTLRFLLVNRLNLQQWITEQPDRTSVFMMNWVKNPPPGLTQAVSQHEQLCYCYPCCHSPGSTVPPQHDACGRDSGVTVWRWCCECGILLQPPHLLYTTNNPTLIRRGVWVFVCECVGGWWIPAQTWLLKDKLTDWVCSLLAALLISPWRRTQGFNTEEQTDSSDICLDVAQTLLYII